MGDDLQQDQSQFGGDPAPWSSALDKIPTQFHAEVTPVLETWYKSQQEAVTNANKQLEPWKQFTDNRIAPDQVLNAWQLASAMENNPVDTIQNIQKYYEEQRGIKFTREEAAQVAQQVQQQSELDPAVSAKFEELKKQQDLMGQIMLKENQDKLARQEDAKVAAEFGSLHKKMTEKFGVDFNEQFVGGVALAAGVSLEQAAEMYYAEINKHAQNSLRPAPTVLGTGGGLPSVRADVRTMSDNQLSDYAADFVRAKKRQLGQT